MNLDLQSLVIALKAKGILPRKIEITTTSGYCFANLYDELTSEIICESVATGFDKNPDMALAKGLSEFYEGKAFKEGYSKNLRSCKTDRSDGFAAYPKNSKVDAKLRAQKNAQCEAIERFVWATWWDDPSIGFEMVQLNPALLTPSQKKFTSDLEGKCNLKKLLLLEPDFQKLGSERFLILIGFLNSGGVVSGGACGEDFAGTLDRALSELFRHSLAISRIRKNGFIPQSFYERRLAYFGSSQGQEAVEKRLKNRGNKKVVLPDSEIDEEISHAASDLIYVHRFLFINQPEFVGGRLERFCI